MKSCVSLFMFFFVLSSAVQAPAGINLVTVSEPAAVQLTIYQPADLCLVREHRSPTLQRGVNRLRISWHGTLIDPTSLEIEPSENEGAVSITDLSFPPGTRGQAICLIESKAGGKAPLEVTYLTSGIRWRPVYAATLTEEGSSLRLDGMIAITNRSGKDYERANFRVLTGDINLVDRVADLARGQDPYGRPSMQQRRKTASETRTNDDSMVMKRSLMSLGQAASTGPPEVTKEGISDFFLFTIEGTQSIPEGWTKSLRFFDTEDFQSANLYKYDQRMYGRRPVRFLTFVNGGVPLPPGGITLYRSTGSGERLCYEGSSKLPYAPAGETVELNLGQVTDVLVEPTLLEEATSRYSFDRKGNISGWDEIHRWKVEISNTRSLPVQVQIDRHASTPEWEIDHDAGENAFKKIDKTTFRFKKTLDAGERKILQYTLTTRQGMPAEQRRPD
jgi:hypothetical protein